MAVITTGSHPKALWPGVKKWWGAEYAAKPQVWKQIFDISTSDRMYEEDVETVGFGLLQTKSEGASITYDTAQQGTVSRYTHVTYALGYIVTMEQLMDNLYEKVSFKQTSKLARSTYATEETVHANVLNRGFDSNYTGGDGKELFSTAHPCANGNQSNHLTTAADISESAIEDLVIQIKNSVDSRGIRFGNKPKRLIIPNTSGFDAARILKSPQQNENANNAINALKAMGTIPEIVEWDYLTDTDAWFIQTDCADGLTHYTRMAATFDKDQDFDSSNSKAKVMARWSQGHSNFRGIFASPGA